MSVESQAIAVDRQVSLLEAFLFALGMHAAILVLLSLLGLLGLLTEHPEMTEDRDIEVRFEVAPEPEAEPLADPAAVETPATTGVEEPPPAQPVPPGDSVPETRPEDTEPVPAAPATLDQPQPLIVPMPPSDRQASETEKPELQEETATDVEEPSPERPEAASEEPPAGEIEDPRATEPIDAPETEIESAPEEATRISESAVDTQLDVPLTDDGEVARPEELTPEREEPAPPGRTEGLSMGERLTDFSRAVQRAREAAPPQPEQAPRNMFEPDWSNLPPHTGQVLGNMMFESGDYDWTDYQRQIYWIIWRTWHNRLLARVDDFEKWAQQNQAGYMEHINQVRFTIERNGEISSITLETESNSIPFDLSSVEGLDEAVLPPLPDDFPRDTETVHAQFIGQGEIALMRRGLQRLKQMGVF